MALSTTFNATSGTSALAFSSTATFAVDLSAKYEGQVTVAITAGGSVSTTAGVQVDVYPGYGTGPTYDSQPVTTFVVPVTTPSAVTSQTAYLGPGKYQVKLTNLDGTNGVSYATALTTVDSI